MQALLISMLDTLS